MRKNPIRIGLKTMVDVFLDTKHKRSLETSLITFPNRIGDYAFVEEFFPQRSSKTYRYGIYQNGSGEKAIAKQWVGKSRSLSWYLLANEISVYRVLWDVLSTHPEITQKFPHVHIPRFIDEVERENSLILLIEYLEESRPLIDFPKERRIATYAQVLEYFSLLGKYIKEKQLVPISCRTVWHSMVLFPIVFVRSLLRHPSYGLFIFRSAIVYIVRIPCLFKASLSFSHRDLGDWNILVRGDDVWIIDFQLSVCTHPLFDAVSITLKAWEDPDFGKRFLESAYMQGLLAKNCSQKEFLALSAHLVLYNLSLRSGRDPIGVINFLSDQLDRGSACVFCKRIRLLWKKLKQEGYILMYSCREKVHIEPFDPKVLEVTEIIIKDVRSVMSEQFPIHLLGSVSMGIAGQRDIDIFVECKASDFSSHIDDLSSIFGKPVRKKRDYIEWQTYRDGWGVDILLIDPTTEKFKDQSSVAWAIQNDEKLKREYEQLKLECNGKSLREYQRRKHKFLEELRDRLVENEHNA